MTDLKVLCATLICVVALMVDGIAALTLSMGVAATLAGVGGYTAGRYRTLKRV